MTEYFIQISIMEYLALIGSVTIIHLLAAMSPGPDFIICARNALTYSRKTGIWTAVGFGLGITVHIFYCLAGLAIVISQSILLFSAIMIIDTMVWFSIVAIFLTHKRIRIVFEKFQGLFNKTLGGMLILLGIKVALTER